MFKNKRRKYIPISINNQQNYQIPLPSYHYYEPKQ